MADPPGAPPAGGAPPAAIGPAPNPAVDTATSTTTRVIMPPSESSTNLFGEVRKGLEKSATGKFVFLVWCVWFVWAGNKRKRAFGTYLAPLLGTTSLRTDRRHPFGNGSLSCQGEFGFAGISRGFLKSPARPELTSRSLTARSEAD